jgi:hypothetical protein
MSQENVEIVRDLFGATNERDFPRAMSHYAHDVELVADPNVLNRERSRAATRLDSGSVTGWRHLSLAITSTSRKRGTWVTLSFSTQLAMGGGEAVERRSAAKRHSFTDFAAARLFASRFIPAAPKPLKPPGCRSRRGTFREPFPANCATDRRAPFASSARLPAAVAGL